MASNRILQDTKTKYLQNIWWNKYTTSEVIEITSPHPLEIHLYAPVLCFDRLEGNRCFLKNTWCFEFDGLINFQFLIFSIMRKFYVGLYFLMSSYFFVHICTVMSSYIYVLCTPKSLPILRHFYTHIIRKFIFMFCYFTARK